MPSFRFHLAVCLVALTAIAAPALAVTNHFSQAGSLGVNATADIGTLTNADLAGNRTIYIDTLISRTEASGGDAWFAHSINSPAGSNGQVATANDLGLLTRTRTDGGGSHQMFNTTGDLDVVGTAGVSRAYATVSLSAAGIQAGQFAGVTYAVDHGDNGSIDAVLAGTFDFAQNQANFDIATLGKTHDYDLAISSTGARPLSQKLLNDDFTVTGTPNTEDVNWNLQNRQASSVLGVTGYRKMGPGNESQVGNTDAVGKAILDGGNVLLVASASGAELARNFNGALSEGGLSVSLDIAPDVRDGANSSDWVSLTFGYDPGVAPDNFAINNPAPHFGILFRENGAWQAFDGSAAIGSGTFLPGGSENVMLQDFMILMTDPTDGNPFDGSGETRFEVFYQATSLFTHTEGAGGFTNNFINIQGNGIGYVDNLMVRNLAVPEPATATLLLLAIGAASRRRRIA